MCPALVGQKDRKKVGSLQASSARVPGLLHLASRRRLSKVGATCLILFSAFWLSLRALFLGTLAVLFSSLPARASRLDRRVKRPCPPSSEGTYAAQYPGAPAIRWPRGGCPRPPVSLPTYPCSVFGLVPRSPCALVLATVSPAVPPSSPLLAHVPGLKAWLVPVDGRRS